MNEGGSIKEIKEALESLGIDPDLLLSIVLIDLAELLEKRKEKE